MNENPKNALKTLPDGYELVETIDIAKQVGLAIVMNIVGLFLFFVSYTIFFRLVRNMRALDSMQFFQIEGLSNVALVIIGGIVFIAALIIFHEAAHGLFFRIYTGVMPKFAIKLSYAYAAAPEWYIRRNDYFIIGAAPVILITVIGLLSCLFIPPSWLIPVILFVSLNFASSVGDFYVLLRLMTKSPDIYVRDEGDTMTFYSKENVNHTL